MDEVIWVEVLSRHRSVLSRHRCEGRVVRIGRAYSNDVVIDDPYVAPEHVHIARDETGALVAEDLGTANGLMADRGRVRERRIALQDDAVICIGNTHLRVRTTDHGVAPERIFAATRRSWPVLLGAGAAVLAAGAALIWMADFTELRTANYVVPLLALAVLVSGWSALWSVVSRIFGGHARFEANLLVGLIAALGFEAWYELSQLGAFGFSWSGLATYRYIGFWCILALAAFAHLQQINPGRVAAKLGVVGAMLAVAVAVQILVQLDPRSGLQQDYVRRLMPPAFRLSPVESEDSFFAAVGRLQQKLDQDRSAEP
jgi:hypothetical protein